MALVTIILSLSNVHNMHESSTSSDLIQRTRPGGSGQHKLFTSTLAREGVYDSYYRYCVQHLHHDLYIVYSLRMDT